MKKKTIAFLMAFALLCNQMVFPVNDVTKPISASAGITDTVPEGYTPIYTIDDLYAVRNDLSGNYILMNDIDLLVEGVYRDKMDRASFYKKFVTFGIALYLLVMLTQFLLGTENYISMLNRWYVQVLLHAIILINSYFLINGTKYYNENTGGE